MFKHNRKLEIDIDNLQDALETILKRATDNNKWCWHEVRMDRQEKAIAYGAVRDAYLNTYYLLTGVKVDYDDLEKE